MRTLVASIGGRTVVLREDRLRDGRAPSGTAIARAGAPGLVEIGSGQGIRRAFGRRLPDGSWEVWIGPHRILVRVEEARHAELRAHVRRAEAADNRCILRAPMPGLIREIAVSAGETVRRGQRLLTLEAMKMENELSSPIDGTVGAFALAAGSSVEKDQELLIITPPSTD